MSFPAVAALPPVQGVGLDEKHGVVLVFVAPGDAASARSYGVSPSTMSSSLLSASLENGHRVLKLS
jgi:hypothetical protein